MKQWYEALFSNYGNQYDKLEFTAGTTGEVDFIESEIGHNRSARILDIGCGTGRHSIELARRGYTVVGIDLSESMLARARSKARSAGLTAEFLKADARKLEFHKEFDLAIMLCEGGFPLMETDEMNFMILQSAANALRDGGKFIFTTLNGLFPIVHSISDMVDKNSTGSSLSVNPLDLMTFRQTSTLTFVDDDGISTSVHCNERYYIPSEITWLLKSLHFKTIDIFGCQLGAFSRNRVLTAEDLEMLVVAKK